MNKKILAILEFDKIKKQINDYTTTAFGEEAVKALAPKTEATAVTKLLDETEDGMTIYRIKGGIPVPNLQDIRPHLKRLEIGALLNGLEIAQIGKVLYTTSELVRFFEELADSELALKRVYELADKLESVPSLSGKIRAAVEEDGRVTDEASPELRTIRHQIRRSEMSVKEQLDGLIRGKNAKYLSDAIITMRNDRYVIPVKSEYRGVFGGVVHDQSASGQTIFVEPKQVVELNNRLRQQQIAERHEVERILAELSNEIAPYRQEIMQNAYVIGQLDFINAKAKFAKEVKAVIPHISDEQQVELKQARHPFISADVAVANDIVIGKDYQTIVITGPNTGGKTITLKTLGLLQIMAQAGLPITAAEESSVAIFKEIFADIGDEQSIEQNLSTFSSHMTNIVSIIDQIDQDSLVLFDELGAGTDPQEGAALAISLLDTVAATGAYVVATTHYPELKVYGYNRQGTINASMEFDVDSLSPTYKLLIGVPGRSNAFEISRRLGLDNQIIEVAQQLVDGESQDLNEMIADLELRRKMAETEYLEVREQVAASEKLLADLKNAYGYFFEEREKEMAKAKEAANKIIEEAKEKSDEIVRDIRKKQQNLGTAHVKEHELIQVQKDLGDLSHEEAHLKKNKVLQKAKEAQVLKPGDDVMVESYGQRGTLISSNGRGQWQVQLGILKMNLPESDLTKVKPVKTVQRDIVRVKNSDGGSRKRVDSQLDLRGMRYDDAVHELSMYLDEALMSGYSSVIIVHGKGTGAIRNAVTDYLNGHRSVKSFGLAPQNMGGTGATVVEFK
ncbi:endonuclease MutS2 [Vagococcus zengguangii]|uniref:Endonuclease MutS2 n=1 Tax=Vagococcus zengguangii TaxID=2571750 RepID=A0A4D7CRS1_9ENTE|nr:endonuclease MutS2 [Vagococcus zengguangii]QCI86779.1 endonuclease MutS2 [Vagococcus zengguangii]TLG80385.1 endonuclease MutS2 [Vagococcus zengguangii]